LTQEWISHEVSRFRLWAVSESVFWAGPSEARVLIIDDDQGLSRLVALVLRRSGFEADVANSGDDGLKLLDGNNYDAVVLDLRMPGKDGRQVFKEMRDGGNHTPVLILSAYDARRAYEDLGSEAYLNKPFEPEKLVAALNTMLARSS
jgi:DNA-binding response OmpR family regulator